MPLSENDKQMIAITISAYIDNFQCSNSDQDLINLIQALNAILTNSTPPVSLPVRMRENIQAVRKYLTDFIAERPVDRTEFVPFVQGIIGKRIVHISSQLHMPLDQRENIELQEIHGSESGLDYQSRTVGAVSSVELGILNNPNVKSLIADGIISIKTIQVLKKFFHDPQILCMIQVMSDFRIKALMRAHLLKIKDVADTFHLYPTQTVEQAILLLKPLGDARGTRIANKTSRSDFDLFRRLLTLPEIKLLLEKGVLFPINIYEVLLLHGPFHILRLARLLQHPNVKALTDAAIISVRDIFDLKEVFTEEQFLRMTPVMNDSRIKGFMRFRIIGLNDIVDTFRSSPTLNNEEAIRYIERLGTERHSKLK